MDEIKFFGEVDRTEKGKIKSEYPAWYFEPHIEDMKEEVERWEREETLGFAPHDPERKAIIKMRKERYEAITKSKPGISDAQKDQLAKEYKKLSKQIRDSMPTRSEMKQGTVSAHEEARRMSEPIINIDADLAKSCGVEVIGGKVSRDGASKIWKITGKYLGEATNVETLRRDRKTGTYKSEDSSIRE